MGWHELKKRAEQFKQQMDAEMASRIRQPSLNFDAPVESRHSYECILEDGAPSLEPGAIVRLINTPDGVDAYKGNRPVGQVDPGLVELVRHQQQLTLREGRAVLGRVGRVSQLTNTFTVDVAD